jgi:arylsulfatase A-like enzyme
MSQGFTRRALFQGLAGAVLSAKLKAQNRPPNVVVIYADDLGYGDLSCYGSSINTPNLDQMAQDGIRFTQFYSASPVCSPSRAALLTGRYPTRVGVPRVMDPNDKGGLSASETTMAEMLKQSGYATMCIGKWHLGTQPQHLPTSRGFDEYYGIPYSNDMYPRVLMHNTEVIEQSTDLSTLTQRYTGWATDFIKRSTDSPFFLYMPHTFPHIPLAASPAFRGASGQGLYGDVVQEIDWSVGRVLQALKDNGLDSNTLVVFSSDNGPWYQGSPGGLRGRKGEIWEGGMREPFIARFPGMIPGGQTSDSLATTMDILPTVASLTGATLPGNPVDGVDITPVLSGQQPDVTRPAFLYFNDVYLQAARVGPWKLHVSRFNTAAFAPDPSGGRKNLPLCTPELYNVIADPRESYDRSERNPAIVANIQSQIADLMKTFPDNIVNAWKDTMRQPVESTPAGSWPVPHQP